jgi:hypothetical protein
MAAQRPDVITLRNEVLQLFTNPLEEYWALKNIKRPEFNIVPYCKRGYIAHWEIVDQKLFLRNIDGYFWKRSFINGKKSIRYTMQTLFPNYKGGLVLAFWFSGKLRIPYGPMRRYDHEGYNSRYEKEILINIQQGSVTKEIMLDFVNQKMTVL